MNEVDINCDLGEGYGRYSLCDEELVMPMISSCNIACGFHAGDPLVIEKSIVLAIKNHVAIGAHPSFPDLQGFGRREMDMSMEELESSVLYQVGAVKSIAEANGGKIFHVKPHGALYNKSAREMDYAMAITRAVKRIDKDICLTGQPNSCHHEAAKKNGISFRAEGFGDRRYHENGQLVSRKVAGSVLNSPEEIYHQIEQLTLNNSTSTIEGVDLALSVDTICLHGDNPDLVDVLEYLVENLLKNNLEVKKYAT